MRFCFVFAALAFAGASHAQEPSKAEATKATFAVSGLRCGGCVSALEGSLSHVKGVASSKVALNDKSAMVDFDENVISAQAVARAMTQAPHGMSRSLHYSGALLLAVPGASDPATAEKASAALTKVEGVAKVTLVPKQEKLAVEFGASGDATTKDLLAALDKAGLKASLVATGKASHAKGAPASKGCGCGCGGGCGGACCRGKP